MTVTIHDMMRLCLMFTPKFHTFSKSPRKFRHFHMTIPCWTINFIFHQKCEHRTWDHFLLIKSCHIRAHNVCCYVLEDDISPLSNAIVISTTSNETHAAWKVLELCERMLCPEVTVIVLPLNNYAACFLLFLYLL